jgi:hypothetical protein
MLGAWAVRRRCRISTRILGIRGPRWDNNVACRPIAR